MINKNILKAVLMTASKEAKDAVLSELLTHIGLNYDYNDEKAGHIIGMLVDKNEVKTITDVNVRWLQNNLNKLMYQSDKYNFKNIRASFVDNIDCTIRVEFEFIEKINEDRGDVPYSESYTNISFLDNPEILK